jgi:hypothetical protein
MGSYESRAALRRSSTLDFVKKLARLKVVSDPALTCWAILTPSLRDLSQQRFSNHSWAFLEPVKPLGDRYEWLVRVPW